MPAAYSAAFLAAVEVILQEEGGYVNDPKDPGGETNFGISKRSYPTTDIKALTRDAAIAIYARDFWRAVQGDALPFPVALVLFDIAVNGGRAVKWLQQALGVTADEVLGPATLAAARGFPDPKQLAARVLRRRVLYYTTLGTFATFGSGWIQRCFDVHRAAIELSPPPDPAPLTLAWGAPDAAGAPEAQRTAAPDVADQLEAA